MDNTVVIIAIISSVSALIVSILTHIKHSKCFGIDIETNNDPLPTNEKSSILPGPVAIRVRDPGSV